MYQTVGHDVIDLYADALGLPLFRRVITGKSINTDLDYQCIKEDEVEDLNLLLQTVKVCSHSHMLLYIMQLLVSALFCAEIFLGGIVK